MKNIKKFLVVTLAFLFTLSLVGCDKKSGIKPTEALKKAQDYLLKIDNYSFTSKIDLSAELELNGEKTKLDVPIIIIGAVDNKNKSTYTSATLKDLRGGEVKNEMYVYQESQDVVLYSNNGLGWITSKTNSQNYNPIDRYTNEISNLLNSKNIKEIESDEKNYNFEFEASKEALDKILSFGSENEKPYIEIENGTKVTISIDKKDYSISKISFDLSDIIKKNEMINYTKSSFELILFNYGTTNEIIVSENIKNMAQEFN